jgi:hypothetical protein
MLALIVIYPVLSSAEESCSSTVSSNLNIHIPSANYQSLVGGNMNLWINLEFSGNDENGVLTWKLKDYGTNGNEVEFVNIPGNGKDIEAFQLAKTEITNQQYVDFLNAALRENMITVGPVGPTNMLIYDKNNNQMMNIFLL